MNCLTKLGLIALLAVLAIGSGCSKKPKNITPIPNGYNGSAAPGSDLSQGGALRGGPGNSGRFTQPTDTAPRELGIDPSKAGGSNELPSGNFTIELKEPLRASPLASTPLTVTRLSGAAVPRTGTRSVLKRPSASVAMTTDNAEAGTWARVGHHEGAAPSL